MTMEPPDCGWTKHLLYILHPAMDAYDIKVTMKHCIEMDYNL